MARRQSAPRDAHQLRRAKPAYVLAVTAITVAFWWLVAASQTTLGGRHAAPPTDQNLSIAPGTTPQEHAKRIAAASAELDAARLAVETARQAVAAAQQRWEDWLARRAGRQDPAELPPPAPDRNVSTPKLIVNPQYLELAHTLQRMGSQRDELLQRLTTEHPAVQEIVARMSTVSDQLATIPEMVMSGAHDSLGAEPVTAEPLREAAPPDVQPAESSLAAAEPSDPTEGEVRKAAWDTAQEELQQRLREEQLAADTCEAARKQAAAARTPEISKVVPLPQWSSKSEKWALILGLGILCGAELAMLRLALALIAAEGTTPLTSVGQVAALLPVPVFAAFPATSETRQLAVRPAGSASGLTLLLLACEGTLAVVLFLTVALTVRNVGFPGEFLRHPIEAMAQGLHELHS